MHGWVEFTMQNEKRNKWRPVATQALVVDVHGGNCRAGFAGDNAPRVVFPSTIKRPNHYTEPRLFSVDTQVSFTDGRMDAFPDENDGFVTNWDAVEKIFHGLFYEELHVEPQQHAVLLTDAPLNPRPNCERMAQSLFETFKVPVMHVKMRPELFLCASGRTTVCVVDSGDQVSLVVPVCERNAIRSAIKRLDIVGRDLTDLLMRTLKATGAAAIERSLLFTSPGDTDIVKRIKEKLTYVTQDFELETEAFSERLENLRRATSSQMGTSSWLAASGSRLQKCSSSHRHWAKK